MIERKADPQNIAANIGDDILPSQRSVNRRCPTAPKGKKAGMRAVVQRVEQGEIRQRILGKKLRLKTRNMA